MRGFFVESGLHPCTVKIPCFGRRPPSLAKGAPRLHLILLNNKRTALSSPLPAGS
jgi:hypothetical protein